MSNRSKAKAQVKRDQKRAEKKRKKAQLRQIKTNPILDINARLSERIAKQKPVAWPDENPVDVALFDPHMFSQLTAEQQQEVTAVSEALTLSHAGRHDDANLRVNEIARTSPLSQWRLLIRGLGDWYAGNVTEAENAWQRLDAARRPARIAAVLLAAPNADTLDETSLDNVASDTNLDEPQQFAARLVRRIRFVRPAIRYVENAVTQPTKFSDFEDSENLFIDFEIVERLKEFSRLFRNTEPKLVAAIERCALQQAYCSEYYDTFRLAQRSLLGPAHDPNNLLLFFHYAGRFNDDKNEGAASLKQYMQIDLPNNTRLSAVLRNAMLSQCHLDNAKEEMNSRSGLASLLRFNPLLGESPNSGAIEKELSKAIACYPQNEPAHRELTDWLLDVSEDEREPKEVRERFEQKISTAMERWAQAIPTAVRPRLWLIDHLLDNDQLDAAQPYIDWMKTVRQDNPRVKATPWKWELMNAWRLSRKKTTLKEVPATMKNVESLWPVWLSRDWLAYLNAGYALRTGDQTAYEFQRNQLAINRGVARNSLSDAVMMLAAAQRMSVPAADLKPLRTPVEEAVKPNQLKQLKWDELAATGQFFWNLHQAGVTYPAYRMHAGKIGNEFYNRILNKPELVKESESKPAELHAICWCSESKFWGSRYEFKSSEALESLAIEVPLIAASLVNATAKLHFAANKLGKVTDEIVLVKRAAKTDPDPFNRFWFRELAENAEADMKDRASKLSGLDQMMDMFRNFAPKSSDDLEPVDDCDCPDCCAKRRAAAPL